MEISSIFVAFLENMKFKNTASNKQLHVRFWFDRKNMELSQIYLAVPLGPAAAAICAINSGPGGRIAPAP